MSYELIAILAAAAFACAGLIYIAYLAHAMAALRLEDAILDEDEMLREAEQYAREHAAEIDRFIRRAEQYAREPAKLTAPRFSFAACLAGTVRLWVEASFSVFRILQPASRLAGTSAVGLSPAALFIS